MNVIVTGGLGAIGSRYAQRARTNGHIVIVVDSGRAERHIWTRRHVASSVPYVRSERCQEIDWAPCFDGQNQTTDLVVHMAAHTGIPHSAEHPGRDWDDNVEGTRNILEGMRDAKSNAILVVTSSVKPYRTTNMPDAGINEDVPLEPDEPYAASKAAQSMLVQAYARTYGLRAVVLRCSNLYSDAPCHGPRHGWLTWMCIAAAIGRPFEIQGSGAQSRDMLFQTDVASAVDACVANIDAVKGNIYNIGGGFKNEISVRGAAEIVRRHLPLETTKGPARLLDDDRFVTDHSRFTEATGWTPKVDVADGIERVCAWAKQNAEELQEVYASC